MEGPTAVMGEYMGDWGHIRLIKSLSARTRLIVVVRLAGPVKEIIHSLNPGTWWFLLS